MSDLHVRVLEHATEFAALRDPWQSLLDDVAGSSFFQSHGFLMAWWRHFGAGKALRIVCAFRGERLVGAMALQLVKQRFGVRTIAMLQFTGMPDDILRPVVLVPEGREDVLHLILRRLDALRDEWDLVRLDEVPEKAWFLPELAAWAERSGYRYARQAFHACPYLVKRSDFAAYLEARSSRFSRRIRQGMNRLRREGRVEFQHLARADDAAGFVERFFAIEQQSWKAGSVAAAGRDSRYQSLYRELLGGSVPDATGHAFVLSVDGVPAAATIAMSWRGSYHSLQIAHDRRFDRFSPGLLLEAHEMEYFFASRALTRYEFMGGEVFSKRRWTDSAVPTVKVSVYKPDLYMTLGMGIKLRVLPVLKRLRNRLRNRLRGRHDAHVEPFRPD